MTLVGIGVAALVGSLITRRVEFSLALRARWAWLVRHPSSAALAGLPWPFSSPTSEDSPTLTTLRRRLSYSAMTRQLLDTGTMLDSFSFRQRARSGDAMLTGSCWRTARSSTNFFDRGTSILLLALLVAGFRYERRPRARRHSRDLAGDALSPEPTRQPGGLVLRPPHSSWACSGRSSSTTEPAVRASTTWPRRRRTGRRRDARSANYIPIVGGMTALPGSSRRRAAPSSNAVRCSPPSASSALHWPDPPPLALPLVSLVGRLLVPAQHGFLRLVRRSADRRRPQARASLLRIRDGFGAHACCPCSCSSASRYRREASVDPSRASSS